MPRVGTLSKYREYDERNKSSMIIYIDEHDQSLLDKIMVLFPLKTSPTNLKQ